MVKTKPEVGLRVLEEGCGTMMSVIDLNNCCRQAYLKKVESIEECKRSTKPKDITKGKSKIDSALEYLRKEMVGLMDQDAGLMKQMLILNEKVEELKANNLLQNASQSLYGSEDSLYESDMSSSDDDSFDSCSFSDDDGKLGSCLTSQQRGVDKTDLAALESTPRQYFGIHAIRGENVSCDGVAR